MILKSVQVQEFQSVRDSNEFSVGDITCLVGKNEAGKTALLQALYRLNPIVESEGKFSVTHDYPRSDVAAYQRGVAKMDREPAVVIRATFELSPDDVAAVDAAVGEGVLRANTLTLSKGYENSLSFELSIDANRAIKNAIAGASLLPEQKSKVEAATKVADAKAILDEAEQTEAVQEVKAKIDRFAAAGNVRRFVFTEAIEDRVPQFLYFDEYYQMKGRANIEALNQRLTSGDLLPSDYPLVGLVHLAGLEIADLLSTHETRELKNRLEGAGNDLTKNVVKYWSQNRHLALRFDVRAAADKDPEGMTSGTNIWGEVYDSRHQVAHSAAIRAVIPLEAAHRFRSMARSDSGGSRAPIPLEAAHF